MIIREGSKTAAATCSTIGADTFAMGEEMNRYILVILTVCAALVDNAARAADFLQDSAVQKEVLRLAIPASLTPKGKQPLFMARAAGFQIYKEDGKMQWVFQEPQATLLDYRTGDEIGTHSKGPTGPIWIDSKGSKVVGKPIGKEPAANTQAVPWLLLEAMNENGGRFAKVTHIQRVDTWAGQMPSVPPTKAGEAVKIPYQATYIFWGD